MKVNYSNLLEKKLKNIEKSGLKTKLLLNSNTGQLELLTSLSRSNAYKLGYSPNI